MAATWAACAGSLRVSALVISRSSSTFESASGAGAVVAGVAGQNEGVKGPVREEDVRAQGVRLEDDRVRVVHPVAAGDRLGDVAHRRDRDGHDHGRDQQEDEEDSPDCFFFHGLG